MRSSPNEVVEEVGGRVGSAGCAGGPSSSLIESGRDKQTGIVLELSKDVVSVVSPLRSDPEIVGLKGEILDVLKVEVHRGRGRGNAWQEARRDVVQSVELSVEAEDMFSSDSVVGRDTEDSTHHVEGTRECVNTQASVPVLQAGGSGGSAWDITTDVTASEAVNLTNEGFSARAKLTSGRDDERENLGASMLRDARGLAC